jgi:hypothetical protein
MEYEIFLYTKTIADDWKFHIVPSTFSKSEQDELRNCIVTGLYANFPSIARSDVEKNTPKNLGVISNFCYCLPFNEYSLVLVLVRMSEFVDYTGRPFWDFAGAYISKQQISLQELQLAISQLLTKDILFKNVDEFLDQTKPAPQTPYKSRIYRLDINPSIDVSEIDVIPNIASKENTPPRLSKEMVSFDSTNRENFQILLSRLNDTKEPILFFTYGPVDNRFFSVRLNAFDSISKPSTQLMDKNSDTEPGNTVNKISDIHTRRHLFLDLITTTLSYSLGVVDVIKKNSQKSNKKDDAE